MESLEQKIKRTVDKTIEALARIERFIDKYGKELDSDSIIRISDEVNRLQNKIKSKS